MEEEIDFFELVLLQRIEGRKENTYIEKLAPELSTSFFEVANRVGSLKLKGYLDIKPALGMSEVVLTQKARELFVAAGKKAEEKNTDIVDREILKEIGDGFNELVQLQNKLRIRITDITLHLHKLHVNSFIDYSIANNTGKFLLTEKGFAKAHSERKMQEKEQEQKPGAAAHPLQEQQKKAVAKEQGVAEHGEENVAEDVKEILAEQKKPEQVQDGPKQYESKNEFLLEKYRIHIFVVAILILIVILVVGYTIITRNSQ